jgi:hypothetical protein
MYSSYCKIVIIMPYLYRRMFLFLEDIAIVKCKNDTYS